MDTSIIKTGSSTTPFTPVVWKMHLIIFSIGLFITGIVGYGFYSGYRINTVDASLVRAAMKVKLEASTTNLVVEGLLGDGIAGDFEPIWELLDSAFQNFRSIYDQSIKRKAVLLFQASAVDSNDIANLSSKLSLFKNNARKRFTNKGISFLDEEVDKIYRLAFKDLLQDLDTLEEKLRRSMANNLLFFKYSQTAMLGLCILMTIFAAIVFQRFESARTKAYYSLQKANEQLETEITERKRSEKALRASEERQGQLIKELKNFSSTVSHDLRAPLINLKGFSKEIVAACELIRPAIETALASASDESKKDLAAAFYDDIPEAIKYINLAVAKMERLINAILKLARVGRRELLLEKLDMNRIVQDTLKSFAYQIKAGGVKISIGNMPETIADKICMDQIFSNLLSNALNYLDPERVGEVEITAENRMDETVFHVHDNGRGIKNSDLKRVFNMFERLGNDSVAGEGMGLAYVQALVRRHQGAVYCESEFGVGTTFTFAISKRLIIHEDLRTD